MITLNKEQMQLLEFLYKHSETTLQHNQLEKSNIPCQQNDCDAMITNHYLKREGYNKSNYTYKITSFGRAYYEWHTALQEERNRHDERENKLLETASNANEISKKANVLSFVSILVAFFLSSAGIIISVISLLNSLS